VDWGASDSSARRGLLEFVIGNRGGTARPAPEVTVCVEVAPHDWLARAANRRAAGRALRSQPALSAVRFQSLNAG